MKHTIRARHGGTIEVDLFRSKAIKIHCTECCGWGEFHPKDCTDKLCALYPFRGISQASYGRETSETVEEDEKD